VATQCTASDKCSSAESDATLFIQHTTLRHSSSALKQENHQEATWLGLDDDWLFPGLSDMLPSFPDFRGEFFSDALSSSVIALVSSADAKLAAVEKKVTHFAEKVRESKGDIQEGVTAILADALNLNVSGVSIRDERYKAVSKASIDALAQVWSMMFSSVRLANTTFSQAANLISEDNQIAEGVQTALEAAVVQCKAFNSSVADLKNVLSRTAAPPAESAYITTVVMLLETPTSYEVISHLNSTVKLALEQVNNFSRVFTNSFHNLTHALLSTSEETLSSRAMTSMQISFTGLMRTAETVSQDLLQVSTDVLESVAAGVAETGIHSSGARSPGALLIAVLTACLMLSAQF